MPFNPLPARAAPRLFLDNDWNADGERNPLDVLTDWRRYIANNILRSPGFEGRRWCIDPASIDCSQFALANTFAPASLPAESLAACPPERSDALLSVSAPGLTSPDFRLNFPDTPIGLTSGSITVILRSERRDSLRIMSTDLLGVASDLDFRVVGTDCLPTADEMRRGVGHELAGGRSCGFQVQFRPQFRPGIGECDRDDTTLSTCARTAGLRITSTTLGGNMMPNITLHLSGRAIGGRMVVEPSSREVCFRSAPAPTECTNQMITIRNEGTRFTTGDLNITSAGLIGTNDFLITTGDVSGRTLVPGDAVNVNVRYCEFRRTADAAYRIYSSSPRGPNPVEMTIFNPNNRSCP